MLRFNQYNINKVCLSWKINMNYLSVAKEYKIPYSNGVSPEKNCNWDGHKMNIKGLKQHSICHEIKVI